MRTAQVERRPWSIRAVSEQAIVDFINTQERFFLNFLRDGIIRLIKSVLSKGATIAGLVFYSPSTILIRNCKNSIFWIAKWEHCKISNCFNNFSYEFIGAYGSSGLVHKQKPSPVAKHSKLWVGSQAKAESCCKAFEALGWFTSKSRVLLQSIRSSGLVHKQKPSPVAKHSKLWVGSQAKAESCCKAFEALGWFTSKSRVLLQSIRSSGLVHKQKPSPVAKHSKLWVGSQAKAESCCKAFEALGWFTSKSRVLFAKHSKLWVGSQAKAESCCKAFEALGWFTSKSRVLLQSIRKPTSLLTICWNKNDQ